jgi:hypothetical protein
MELVAYSASSSIAIPTVSPILFVNSESSITPLFGAGLCGFAFKATSKVYFGYSGIFSLIQIPANWPDFKLPPKYRLCLTAWVSQACGVRLPAAGKIVVKSVQIATLMPMPHIHCNPSQRGPRLPKLALLLLLRCKLFCFHRNS